MSMKLFDEKTDEDVEKISKIEINEEFAKRYEHNKRREGLQRLEELKKKGLIQHSSGSDTDDEESDEEDEEEDLKGSSKTDLEFFDALIKVRNQDPVFRNRESKLFDTESSQSDDDEESELNDGKRVRNVKAVYLKDVVSKHLIEGGPEFDDDEERMEVVGGVKSYNQEQEELRKEFLEAVKEAEKDVDEGGDLFSVKEKESGDVDDGDDMGEVGKKMDEYFGEDEKLDEDTKFLKEFFQKKMWVGGGKDGGEMGEEGEGFRFSEDEEEIERQEDYEREYNFRYEENAGDRVMGHSRIVEGSVRKKENARKNQRKSKEERMALAELERREEVKHLKNLKKKEVQEKIQKFKEVAGIGEDGELWVDLNDLEEDFDPEKYDKKMKKIFDDRYYDAADVDPGFGTDSDEENGEFEKPDFDKEDELLGLPKGWDNVNGPTGGFSAIRDRLSKRKVDSRGDQVDDEQIGEQNNEDREQDDKGDIAPAKSKEKKKRKLSDLVKEENERLRAEFNKLEYEDTVGDLKTRFKYRDVKENDYGLDIFDILLNDEKELNQCVSLKKLSTYRSEEWEVPRTKILPQKKKTDALIEENILNIRKNVKKKFKGDGQKLVEDGGSQDNEKLNLDESNGDMTKLSKKSKRRRRQAEFRLSDTRLKAYGKIPSKSKSKKKH